MKIPNTLTIIVHVAVYSMKQLCASNGKKSKYKVGEECYPKLQDAVNKNLKLF